MTEVGDTASRSRMIEAGDIERFTEISGDRNPLHYDAEAAAASRFGRIIVQGGVTTALLNALVAEDLPGPGSVFLNVDWSFRAPVAPGDEITATAEVLEVRDDKPIVPPGDDHHQPGGSGRGRRHGPRVAGAPRLSRQHDATDMRA